MKNLTRRMTVLFSALVLTCATMSTFSASAATWTNASTTAKEQGKDSFKKKWSKTITLDFPELEDVGELTMTIGYDTWCTNEDYVKNCWAPTSWRHYGKVKNSNGSTESTKTTKGGFNSDKADVKHTGSTVTYYGYLEV